MSPDRFSTNIDRWLNASKDVPIYKQFRIGEEKWNHASRRSTVGRRKQKSSKIYRLWQWHLFVLFRLSISACSYFRCTLSLGVISTFKKSGNYKRVWSQYRCWNFIIDHKSFILCAGDQCEYTVSNKQKINWCTHHPISTLISTGPCNCHIMYVYPHKDKRWWFMVLNSQNNPKCMIIHPHPSVNFLQESKLIYIMLCQEILISLQKMLRRV